jgi:DNA ligase 4
MMQPTPAPSSAPGSPKGGIQDPTNKESWVDEPIQAPPINRGSAPFGVLVELFEKLSNERKIERRKRLLNSWFGVRIVFSVIYVFFQHSHSQHWREEKGHDLYPVLRLILPQVSIQVLKLSTFQRARCTRKTARGMFTVLKRRTSPKLTSPLWV